MKDINMFALYETLPMPELLPIWKRDNPFHCINWTFLPRKGEDGKIYMDDTYFSSPTLTIELTEENVDKFKPLFDFREVREVGTRYPMDYESSDVFRAAIDSGGWSGAHYFIKKDARPSVPIMIARKEEELRNLQRDVKYLEAEIERLYKKLDEETGEKTSYSYKVFYDDDDILSDGTGFATKSDAMRQAVEDKHTYGWTNATVYIF